MDTSILIFAGLILLSVVTVLVKYREFSSGIFADKFHIDQRNIDLIFDIASRVVDELNDTLVKEMLGGKKKPGGPKLSKEQGETLKEIAMQKVEMIIGSRTVESIGDDRFRAAVSTAIENAVSNVNAKRRLDRKNP